MQKGDKFIVVDDSTNLFQKGEIVIYNSLHSLQPDEDNWYNFINKNGVEQCLTLSQIKPLDRFPCDDEQANID